MIVEKTSPVCPTCAAPAAHEPSYWAATANIAPPSSPLSADLDIDVAVIGAGYTGLSTAYHLKARHGITATVVEAHRIGWGCSGRNGGFAMIGVGKDSHASWIRRFGLAEARRAFEFGRDAVRTLRTVLEEARIESASGNEGFLYVAHRPSRVAELVAMQRQLKQYFGFETELIGCDALRQEYLNGAQLHGALHYPEHFPIHPMRYVQALGKAVKALGVPVHENSPVRQWERVGDRHVLRTPAGSLRAKRVVIATNAYTPDRLHPLVQGKLMNVLSNIIVTVPLTADQRAATNWRTHKMLVDTRHLRFYWRLLEDERILFGARGGIEDTPASRAAMRLWMHEQLLARFPGLGSIDVDYFWQGWVAIARDKGPHIGLADDGTIAYSLGYAGTGVAMSTHCGKLLADALARGQALDVPAMVGAPLPSFEVPALRKLYQRAAYGYFHIKDEYL